MEAPPVSKASSPLYLQGEALAAELARKLIDDAVHCSTLDKVDSLKTSRMVDIPATQEARDEFLNGFWALVKANSGLLHAEGLRWTFTLVGGYHGPSELVGVPTGIPRHEKERHYLRVVRIETLPEPRATFSMSLHPFAKRGPELVR